MENNEKPTNTVKTNENTNKLTKINKKIIKFPSKIKDPFITASNYIHFQISNVIFNEKFYFCYLIENLVILFNADFKLISKIDLKNLKKINLSGRYSLILKFFSQLKNDNNLLLKIKLFSKFQRELIVNNILPNSTRDLKLLKQKLNIYKILCDKKYLLDEFTIYLINKLELSGLLYNRDVYDILKSKPTNKNQKINFKKILFIFSEMGLIKNIFQILFYNIAYIKYDTSELEEMYNSSLMSIRTHRDSVVIRRQGVNQRRSQSIKSVYVNSEANINNKSEEINNVSLDTMIEEFESKNRPRHKNNNDQRSKSNYIKHSNFSPNGSLHDIKIPDYDKITFNVTIPKYFRTDHRTLEINKNGFFSIFKNDKVIINKSN
jgi:hypothetical protein